MITSGIAKHDWLEKLWPKPWWRRLLGLCRPGRKHDWEPVGFADFRCGNCGTWR